MRLRQFLLTTIIFFSVSFLSLSQDLNDLIGKVAYIGNDSNIYTIDLNTDETIQLTFDGSTMSSYEFPTWSKDGQLAYFCCNVIGSEAPKLSIFLSDDGVSNGLLVYEKESERHVYAFWSPVTCETDLCVDLAVLIQDFAQTQLRVELFNSNDIETGQRNLGVGLPFYYSWSPDGDSLVLYRNNDRLQFYSVGTANIDTATDQQLGTFLSPAWSPTDDRILFALANQDKSQLAILENGNINIVSDELDGLVSFIWSPDGKYIAYRVAQRDALSMLYVIDAQTGERISQSSVSGVISFFWSPDSTKIAYITLSDTLGSFDIRNSDSIGDKTYMVQSVDSFAWNILNIDDSSNILLNSFIPSLEMQYMLNNFEQFAQSHSFWSPDSQYLIYSHYVDEDFLNPRISILSVMNPNSTSTQLADGKLGIWSYR